MKLKRNNKNNSEEAAEKAPISIGELFLNRRTQIGFLIEDVADAVKLSVSVIEKLESDKFKEIGGHVYVRGYLSQYAKFLGLDAAYVLGVYHNQFPQENVPIRPSLGEGSRKKSQRHSKTLSFLFAFAAFVALMVAYAKFEPQFFPDTITVSENIVDNKVALLEGKENSQVSSAVRAANSAQTLADDVLNDMTLPSTSSTGDNYLSNSDRLDADSPRGAGGDIILSSANDFPVDNKDIKNKQSQLTEDSVETKTNANVEIKPSASDTIHLVMTFKNDCWIKITDSDKKVLATNVYSLKKKIDVKGKLPFNMIVARKLSVETISINGKKVKLSDYQVGNVKYTIK